MRILMLGNRFTSANDMPDTLAKLTGAEILSETAFLFSPNEYISIHRKLFQGIYKHAGKMRDCPLMLKCVACSNGRFCL